MSELSEKLADLRRQDFLVGASQGEERRLPGGGRFQEFERATIFNSKASGTHVVEEPFRTTYLELGGPAGELGYPISDSTLTGDASGRFIRFERGSLYLAKANPGLGVYKIPPPTDACDVDPEEHGVWEEFEAGSGVVGVHAALLPNDNVLFFTYMIPPNCPSKVAPFGESTVVDFGGGAISTPLGGAPMENLFCAHQAFLADGSLMVGGGEREDEPALRRPLHAVKAIHVFTPGGPGGGEWTEVAECARGRWYPTCSTMPDGRVLIVGGQHRVTYANEVNATLEIFDPQSATVGPEIPIPDPAFPLTPNFPFVFMLPGSKVLIHFGTRTRFFNRFSSTFDNLALNAADRPGFNARTYGLEGSAVLLPLRPTSIPPYRARVMVIGGGGDPEKLKQHHVSAEATPTCEILDMGKKSPAWKLVASMKHPRVMPDAVLLPDGKVFVCNGSRSGKADAAIEPVYEAETYDPETNTWETNCHMQVARLYHATALLLSDGRVLSAGTDCAWNLPPFRESQLRVEIFSPSYCFKNRPHIGFPVDDAKAGSQLEIPTDDADRVESVALLRCGSVTHSFNSDQRYVAASIAGRSSDSVRIKIPSDTSVVIPGPYLVFLLDENRTPSVGRYVLIGLPPKIRPIKQPIPKKKFELPDYFDRSFVEILTKRLEEIETTLARHSNFVTLREQPLPGHHGEGPQSPVEEEVDTAIVDRPPGPTHPHDHGHDH